MECVRRRASVILSSRKLERQLLSIRCAVRGRGSDWRMHGRNRCRAWLDAKPDLWVGPKKPATVPRRWCFRLRKWWRKIAGPRRVRTLRRRWWTFVCGGFLPPPVAGSADVSCCPCLHRVAVDPKSWTPVCNWQYVTLWHCSQSWSHFSLFKCWAILVLQTHLTFRIRRLSLTTLYQLYQVPILLLDFGVKLGRNPENVADWRHIPSFLFSLKEDWRQPQKFTPNSTIN